MAGYIRQSSYTDGDVITAAHSNDEFNQVLAAFSNTAGHKHDGTAAEGPVIGLIGDPGVTTPINKVVVDDTNNRVGVFVDVSGSTTEQIRFQDGLIAPVTDNDIDLGTSSLEFKDLFLDGTATIDTLLVDESATITANLTVNGNTTLGNAASDTVTITADVASSIIPSADNTHDLGASGSEWKDLYIDGVAYVDGIAMPSTTVTDILDEDNMASNSATALVTQQSIKAYVDAQLTAQDLDFQADSGGALNIDLDSETLTFTGGTGIDTSGSGNAVTFAIDSTVATLTGSQTLTNKTLNIDNNTLSNVEVDNFKASAIVTESEGIGSNDNDTTLPTSAAVKDYVDTQITAEDLDVTTDSGTIAIDLDSETLTVAGGTGINSSATSNTVTLAIDNTVTTLAGTQTLTNKTLTSPTINGGSLSSAVTGATQAAGTNNTTIATTAFAATVASNEAVALAIALG